MFAQLGEQAVLSKVIYCSGDVTTVDNNDNSVFGYQERWAEYRYHPSMVSSFMRSSNPLTLDIWHLAQNFASRPVLDPDFINEQVPLNRVLAAGDEATGQQFICDCFFSCSAARAMPLYSVPGMIDHF